MSGRLLGQFEVAALEAVRTGTLGSRRLALRIGALRSSPAADALLHEALRGCERRGLLVSRRDQNGRLYELTRAGRSRLKAQRRFALALARLPSRSED